MALINETGTPAGSASESIEPRTFLGMNSSVSLSYLCTHYVAGLGMRAIFLHTWCLFSRVCIIYSYMNIVPSFMGTIFS